MAKKKQRMVARVLDASDPAVALVLNERKRREGKAISGGYNRHPVNRNRTRILTVVGWSLAGATVYGHIGGYLAGH